VDERDSLEQEKDQLVKQVEDIKDKVSYLHSLHQHLRFRLVIPLASTNAYHLSNCDRTQDEARQLSTKLKDAWIKLSTLSAEKNDYVQKLFKSEDINAKLNADMTKAADLYDATKDAHTEEKRQWEAERREHIAEIESLKVLSYHICMLIHKTWTLQYKPRSSSPCSQ
jgi:dGTP triphosphohydrolase